MHAHSGPIVAVVTSRSSLFLKGGIVLIISTSGIFSLFFNSPSYLFSLRPLEAHTIESRLSLSSTTVLLSSLFSLSAPLSSHSPSSFPLPLPFFSRPVPTFLSSSLIGDPSVLFPGKQQNFFQLFQNYFFLTQVDLRFLTQAMTDPMFLSDHHPIMINLTFPDSITITKLYSLFLLSHCQYSA